LGHSVDWIAYQLTGTVQLSGVASHAFVHVVPLDREMVPGGTSFPVKV
jgi:hypothetical protein